MVSRLVQSGTLASLLATSLLSLAAITMAMGAGQNDEVKPAASDSEKSSLKSPPIAEFEDYLSNSKLIGVFTVDGAPLSRLQNETYVIKTAKRLEGYDKLWEIVTRIQYGDKDIELPVEIDVEWIGRTPVMVMEGATIPGLGTFSARVVFHDKKYAGTWKHGEKGGHLFGRVEKVVDQTEAK